MEHSLKGKKIVVIGQVWPESRSSAAGKRMLQLLAVFQSWEMEIYFGSTAQQTPYSDDLSPFGVKEVAIYLNDERTDQILANIQPDWVMYDRFMIEEQFGWRITAQCPDARTILDTEDLHFLRYARQELVKKGGGTIADYWYSDRTKRELASIMRCDLTLLISPVEYNLLVEHFHLPAEVLWVLPFLEPEISQEEQNSWLTFDQREGFVFIGNFIHEPNWHTVLRLKTEIWPLIRKQLPQVKLHIYGAYPSAKVMQLHKPTENFWVHGRAADALAVIGQARVLLAPIAFGAGIKGKFIDGMRVGTPNVTTPVGIEAMAEVEEWPGFVAEEVDQLVEKAIELYQTEAVWQEKQLKGIELIRKKYNKTACIQAFKSKLIGIDTTIDAYRKSHFLHEVFKYHSAQSTKYMALWIEEKNKHKKSE
ncbi:glycosyltransferase [Myroides sp. NP-2]|uniref:glycosyltransferase n=1 Tax=Myroides sp. NP-2 TaxID=2759945 RepID=UPI0015FCF1D6|nr:glycosyltransferase family 4 protein [Myroides sp. NP-2]MBB1148600.1 glycosyltransferase [Myroides sp. NP-2]